MTVRDVVAAVRRFWPLCLVVLGGFLLLGIAAAYLPQERYTASTLMFVEPASAQSLDLGAQSLDLLLPSIVAQAKTRRFNETVRAAASQDLGDTSITATSEPGTGVLTVTGDSSNPQLAALAANTAAAQLSEDRLSTAVRLSVLDPAVAPEAPSSPKRKPILLACLVLGAIVAVFAAIAANTLRRRVAGAETIRQGFGLTVLGEITRSRRIGRSAMIARDGGPPEIVEEYHRLRTSFELLARDHRTVAVTSWTQGEGKTTVTANLGWMLASLGRQVTIVDLDLRRPSLHVPFGLELGGGVADLSAGGGKSRSRSPARPKPTDLPGLEIFTAGVLHGEPAKVIEDTFPTITEMLDDQLVLIDTPPLLAAETALIASMVDALVIVIDVRRRDPSELEALLQVLTLTRTTILGVVLNQVRRTARQRQISDYYFTRTPTGSL